LTSASVVKNEIIVMAISLRNFMLWYWKKCLLC